MKEIVASCSQFLKKESNFVRIIMEKKTIDIHKASNLALLLFLAFAIIFGLPFYLIWKPLLAFSWQCILIFGVLFIIGVVVHELIHCFVYGLFAKNGFKSIRFGVLWEYLTPYCHCSEPVKLKHYIIGALMPALILGFLPATVSLLNGSLMLLILGVIFISAAAGDFYIVWILRKESMRSLVQDHPSEPGCFIYREE